MAARTFTADDLRPGTVVLTPLGRGTVNYIRMDHLNDIRTVAAVSVILDSKAHLPRHVYAGTLFSADRIEIDGGVQ